MLHIYCPHCQEQRDECEFACAGEAYIKRPDNPANTSDEDWGNYVFNRINPKGMHFEQWLHAHGCRKMLVMHRNTATNRIERCGTLAEMKPLWQKAMAAAKHLSLPASTRKTSTSHNNTKA